MHILDNTKDPAAVASFLQRKESREENVDADVAGILEQVRTRGDEAVFDLTAKFDCPNIRQHGLRVSRKEIRSAYRGVTPQFLRALQRARRNIVAFHRKQRPSSWVLRRSGVSLQQRFLPIDRVGVYVPGGKGAYLSTVMMNALPASIAGVREIVMVSPCGPDGQIAPQVLVAAGECGITEIYRIGGAQAIAALAYGTATLAKVDKITGPGNAYVAAAKRMVFGICGIDMIAGPTEVLIVTDASAPAEFVAADMIAQAEHDERAMPLCVTTSRDLAGTILVELDRQLVAAPRAAIARAALESHGAVIVVASLAEAARLSDRLAPEHLEVMVVNPAAFVKRVRNAGSIFVGPWSMEALGDYAAGPNHTLPTSGTARFSSALGVYDFMKFSNIIRFDRKATVRLAPVVETLAIAEGFPGHAASAAMRRKAR